MVKLFVGNIPDDLYGNEIRELFETYGTVEESTRLSKFAFVHMPNKDEADKALKELNKYHIRGHDINVEISTSTAGEKGGPSRNNRSDRDNRGGGGGGGGGSAYSSMRGLRRGGGMSSNGGGQNNYGHNRGNNDRFHPYDLPPGQQQQQQSQQPFIQQRPEYERYFEKRPLNEMERRLLSVLLKRRDDFDGPQQQMQQPPQQPQDISSWSAYNRPPPDAYKRAQEVAMSTCTNNVSMGNQQMPGSAYGGAGNNL